MQSLSNTQFYCIAMCLASAENNLPWTQLKEKATAIFTTFTIKILFPLTLKIYIKYSQTV